MPLGIFQADILIRRLPLVFRLRGVVLRLVLCLILLFRFLGLWLPLGFCISSHQVPLALIRTVDLHPMDLGATPLGDTG